MFADIIDSVNTALYGWVLIILLLAVGIYFTFATGFVQLRFFGEALRAAKEKPAVKGGISSFAALMTSTASRVGTGNIIGVSTAICLGGSGAVFWMWVIALIGGATAFIESTLAQIYKKRSPDGSCYGGPSYYIETALKKRLPALVFAVCLILTYAGGFNLLASYNLHSTFEGYAFYQGAAPYILGAVLALLFGLCIFGGGKRIAKISQIAVPVMGIFYVLLALAVIILNLDLLPAVFSSIFADAFDFRSIFGGFGGSCLMYGIKRGLFSNEAGVGSAPNAAATALVSHPVKQGLVQMLSVFIDTLLLCTATALMCLCSGVAPEASLAGAPYAQASLANVFGIWGQHFLTFAMVLFVFTTLLGNFYYCEGCLRYIFGHVPKQSVNFCFRLTAVAIVFVGTMVSLDLAWDIADVLMGIMALINLPVIFLLQKPALKALADYKEQKQQGSNPVFKKSNIGISHPTDFWNS
ncbi:MAG: alanine/glycine:cation symporter family protein [Bacillota bacterium]|jgi:AGCS family alanine or glycine:cation symporter